ncbi:hypothetical protein [Ancylobacter sp. G4_0304]|uniref:hypothetical protein n=1 Tax=Ancylobacter sp. G4_0304 TaxID=3114289 RepID=UPI0039C5C43A
MAAWVRRLKMRWSGKPEEPAAASLPNDENHPNYTMAFADVIDVENREIWKRRALRDRCALPPRRREEIPETLGLALSGGGIRSAAVCLGVVQGLESLRQLSLSPLGKPMADPARLANEPRTAGETSLSVFDRFDYLSTVSGGGYLGCCIAAAMSGGTRNDPFPLRSAFDALEPPAVRHLRDHSNYLFGSPGALLGAIATYLRGLTVNLFLTLPLLLGLAALVIFYARLAGWQPALGRYRPEFWPDAAWFPLWPLPVVLAGLFAVGMIFWGVKRSRKPGLSEVDDPWSRRVFWALIVLAFAGLLAFTAEVAELAVQSRSAGRDLAVFTTALAPVATVFAFLAPRLMAVVEKLAGKPGYSALIARFSGIALLWLGAAILPVLLWLGVVLLVTWALPPVCPMWNCPPVLTPCMWAVLYLVGAVAIWRASPCFADNANSLHRLYRDRLSRAFLIRLTDTGVAPLDGFRLTDRQVAGTPAAAVPPAGLAVGGLAVDASPYLLVNTAVNIQASEAVNKRGRNADFFLFSRNYVGSTATGYRRTELMMRDDPALDLATAMAASGAAFSSNMGANTLAPLAPTLTLLNARLGYWLPNPMEEPKRSDLAARRPKPSRLRRVIRHFYFIAEAFGQLDETGSKVYITDGGHIDNLGLFELLRRRCRLIVVVDAESDAQYRFSSLVALQKHARIDLGVRIELPWEAIARVSKGCDDGEAATAGPHAAVGRILYARNDNELVHEGILVYLKSSLTGDENDLIRAYKARNPSFPHQTTIDQLFSEEQFEVYRALGFHMANRLFSGKDRLFVASAGEGEGHEKAGREVENIAADDALLAQVVELLRLPVARRRV